MDLFNVLGDLTWTYFNEVDYLALIAGISLVVGMLVSIDFLGGIAVAGGWIGIAANAHELDNLVATDAIAAGALVVAVALQFVAARRILQALAASSTTDVDSPSPLPALLALAAAAVGNSYVLTHLADDSLAIDKAWLVTAAVGLVVGVIGYRIASSFLWGSVKGGAVRSIVSITVLIGSLLVAAIALFIPYSGIILVLLAIVVMVRQRRRAQAKYKGLRILS